MLLAEIIYYNTVIIFEWRQFLWNLVKMLQMGFAWAEFVWNQTSILGHLTETEIN